MKTETKLLMSASLPAILAVGLILVFVVGYLCREAILSKEDKALRLLRTNGAQISDHEPLTNTKGLQIIIDHSQMRYLGALRNIKNLISLSLSSDHVSDEDLYVVSELSTLRVLILSYPKKVGDSGIAYLANLKALEMLNLPSSRISDKGVKHLTKLKNLKFIDLRDTELTDASVEFLSQLPKNIQVNLSGATRISEKGIEELRRRRPDMLIYHRQK